MNISLHKKLPTFYLEDKKVDCLSSVGRPVYSQYTCSFSISLDSSSWFPSLETHLTRRPLCVLVSLSNDRNSFSGRPPAVSGHVTLTAFLRASRVAHCRTTLRPSIKGYTLSATRKREEAETNQFQHFTQYLLYIIFGILLSNVAVLYQYHESLNTKQNFGSLVEEI